MDNLCEDVIIIILKYSHVNVLNSLISINAIYKEIVYNYLINMSSKLINKYFRACKKYDCMKLYDLYL